MMGQIGGDMSNWNQIQVVADQSYSFGDGVKSWIQSVIPNAVWCIVVKDDPSTTVNNQLIQTTVYNGVFLGYVRYRDGSAQQMTATAWTSAYACAVSQGDVYTILYQ